MDIKHDGKIDIAVGLGARSKVWKRKNWLWSDLVTKLITPNPTNETSKQYFAASKDERSKIKDVGGYVGGYLRGGRRKPENVVHRQLITLDIDFAHLDIWEDFTMIFENAAVLHATHSHSEENPKYRLIMPLSRECSPDEYVAVGRQIAGYLGIEYFDNTGFQPYRLMFWPSSPSDAEYYAKLQDGVWVDVDAILDSYLDWTDSSLWPTSAKQMDGISRISKKQEDPAEKRGVIGAFCRTYGISEAIGTFLKDEYVEVDDTRFTYLKGSTAGGLIAYEDKFAYSHHGTDPCGGKLCNAFDLVRIHKFGHLDSGARQPNVTKLESYRKMEEFAREDKPTKRTIANENLNSAAYDFAEDYEEAEVVNLDWAEDLEVDSRGRYLSSANNLNLIFANDPRLKGIFKHNQFDNKRYLFESVPWRTVPEPEVLKNVDYSGIRNYIESIYNIVGTMKIDDSLALEFQKQSFHPIKDYLSSLQWDGKDRIDSILIDYFGVVDNLYTREAIRKMLVASVARIFKPGIKFDLVLTLVGDQGTGKSTLAKKLGKQWFSDTFMTVHGKEALEQIQGAWIIEMAELSGLRKAEVEAIKHFISKQEDTFRPAYARVSETFKRQCVFIATTNKRDFLTDPSGNRRFMPVDVEILKATKDIFKLEDVEIDQIWAEAVELFKSGEKLYLSDEANALAKIAQRSHGIQDERVGLIQKYLDVKLPDNWKELDVYERRVYIEDDNQSGTRDRDYVCVAEVWCECLGKAKEDMSRYNTRDINDILKGLDDWTQANSTKNFKLYGKQKYYSKNLM